MINEIETPPSIVTQESDWNKKISTLPPSDLFKGFFLDKLIEEIREQSISIVPDLSTDKSRKAIASNAYKVTRSKTAIIAASKELIKTLEEEIAPINERIDGIKKSVKSSGVILDSIQSEVRAPLSNWELAEKTRIQNIKLRVEGITSQALEYGEDGRKLTKSELQGRLDTLECFSIEGFEEFTIEAEAKLCGTIECLKDYIEVAQLREDKEKSDREQAEAKEIAEQESRDKKAKIKAEEEAEQRIEAADNKARLETLRRIEADKRRKANIIDNIEKIKSMGTYHDEDSSQTLQTRIGYMNRYIVNDSYEEHEAEAHACKAAGIEKLRYAFTAATNREFNESEAKKKADKQAEADLVAKGIQEAADRERSLQESREADIEHKRTINRKIIRSIELFISQIPGMPKESTQDISIECEVHDIAVSIFLAIATGKFPEVSIKY